MEDRAESSVSEVQPEEDTSGSAVQRWWNNLKRMWQAGIARITGRSAAEEDMTAEEDRVLRPTRGSGVVSSKEPFWSKWVEGRPQPLPVDQEEIARWVALLARPDDPAHARALDELVVIGQPAVPALIHALRSDTWIQVFRASEALGLIGSRRAVGPLTRLLGHPNSNVRWGAAEALGRLRSRWARGALRRVAQEDESRTSWGETVSEAAERAVAAVDRTWISRSINALYVLFYLALCAAVVYAAFSILRQGLQQRAAMVVPTVLPTYTPTAKPTPEPTQTPVPDFQPVAATIINDLARVRDRPEDGATIIGNLHYSDEIMIYGGVSDGGDGWWYLIRLVKINNPATAADVLESGAYGWVHSSLVEGVDTLSIGPTVAAVETARAAVATPTPMGSSLDLPTPAPTETLAPTP